MLENVSSAPSEFWRDRLHAPAYGIGEAARYAHISPATVAAWHRPRGHKAPTLSLKDRRTGLSYAQLIEVAVVAAFRSYGVTLRRIREARDYVAEELKSDHPFAEYRFKSDGRLLWVNYSQIVGLRGRNRLLGVNEKGQFSWEEVIGRRLREFSYENDGIVVRWNLRGAESPVYIDPRIAFGAPVVAGTPTWIIHGRWEAGESIEDIADDFDLDVGLITDALRFEGIEPDVSRPSLWVQ